MTLKRSFPDANLPEPVSGDPRIVFPRESLGIIARHYTREAGVRKLEQLVGTVCRKQARRIAEGKTEPLTVTDAVIHEFLGGYKVRVDHRDR